MQEITSIKLGVNGRTKSGIKNLNRGGGSITIVIRMNMESKRMAPLEIVIIELWAARTRG
jgi:hypothetical protein